MTAPYPRVYIDPDEFDEPHNTKTKFCMPNGRDGDYVYQLIGKIKETERIKPWIVNHTYKDESGNLVRILADKVKGRPGKIIGLRQQIQLDGTYKEFLYYYNDDGTLGTESTGLGYYPKEYLLRETEIVSDIIPIGDES